MQKYSDRKIYNRQPIDLPLIQLNTLGIQVATCKSDSFLQCTFSIHVMYPHFIVDEA